MKTGLKEYLTSMVEMVRQMRSKDALDHPYFCVEDFILANGRYFFNISDDEEFLLNNKGEAKQCFANSQRYLVAGSTNSFMLSDELLYTEGFAIADDVPIPLYHAWLTRKGTMEVIDLTWKKGIEYFGVIFPTALVLNKVLERERYAPLVDDWENDFPFLTGKLKYKCGVDSLNFETAQVLKEVA